MAGASVDSRPSASSRPAPAWNLGSDLRTRLLCGTLGLLEPGFMLPIQVYLLSVLYAEQLIEPGLVSSLPTERAFISASEPLSRV